MLRQSIANDEYKKPKKLKYTKYEIDTEYVSVEVLCERLVANAIKTKKWKKTTPGFFFLGFQPSRAKEYETTQALGYLKMVKWC